MSRRLLQIFAAVNALIFVGFMCVGVGRLAAVLAHGVTSENTVPVIALEILIPLACVVWQGFVAKEAA